MDVADVVIPTFNDAATLGRAARSAADCAFVRRVIVVDDGSSPAVDAGALGAAGGKVEVVRKENGGPSAARNVGLDAIGGGSCGFVFFLDADDVLLESAASAIQVAKDVDAAAVISSRRGFAAERGPGSTDEVVREVPAEWAGGVLPDPAEVFRPTWLYGGSGVLITRKAIEAGVRFDERLKHGEDRDFLRACCGVGAIGVNPGFAIAYAMHEEEGGGVNLCSPVHYARRVRDFVMIVEKHSPMDARDMAAEERLREGARWLVSRLAKTGAEESVWRELVGLCRARGWGVPMKARVRRAIRGRQGAA